MAALKPLNPLASLSLNELLGRHGEAYLSLVQAPSSEARRGLLEVEAEIKRRVAGRALPEVPTTTHKPAKPTAKAQGPRGQGRQAGRRRPEGKHVPRQEDARG